MAARKSRSGRKCRCKNGKYSVRCCNQQRGGRSVSSQSSRRSHTTRTPTHQSRGFVHPTMGRAAGPTPKALAMEIGEVMAERRAKMAITAAALHPKTRRAVAYQVMQLDQKLLSKVASKGAREAAERGLLVIARVGLKAVPIIGWISLAYDVYTVGKIVHEYVEEREEAKGSAARARQ